MFMNTHTHTHTHIYIYMYYIYIYIYIERERGGGEDIIITETTSLGKAIINNYSRKVTVQGMI